MIFQRHTRSGMRTIRRSPNLCALPNETSRPSLHQSCLALLLEDHEPTHSAHLSSDCMPQLLEPHPYHALLPEGISSSVLQQGNHERTHRYSRGDLYKLNPQATYPPVEVFDRLKNLGLFHSRGCKAGRNKGKAIQVKTSLGKQKQAATVKIRNY